MSIIVIGVNYASLKEVARFISNWQRYSEVSRIVIVDNYSSYEERNSLRKMCNENKFIDLIERENDGYGAALNDAIKFIMPLANPDTLVIFGNVDIMPVHINLTHLELEFLPESKIIQNSKNKNPFLTRTQILALPLVKAATIYRSKSLLYCWLLAIKLLKNIPSKTWTVHGSVFAATAEQLSKMGQIFDPNVFLYGEEMFFGRAAQEAGLKFKKCDIIFEHIGSVSTEKFIKLKKKEAFDNWLNSMRIYFKIGSGIVDNCIKKT